MATALMPHVFKVRSPVDTTFLLVESSFESKDAPTSCNYSFGNAFFVSMLNSVAVVVAQYPS